MTKITFSNALTLAVLTAGLSLVSTPASADTFTVDANPYLGAFIPPANPDGIFDADRIVGGYTERFTVTAPGEFTTDAFYNVGQFFLGSDDLGGGVTGESVAYNLYATFSATGTFETDADGNTEFIANPGGGSVELYADRNMDTTLAVPPPPPGGVDRTNFGDDDLLATATLLSGGGFLRECEAGTDPDECPNGDFSLIFNPFALTAFGSAYFIAPSPFYLELLLEGQFNSFVPEGSQIITGSADATFEGLAVPEPASMALFGIGLLGLAARRRRKA